MADPVGIRNVIVQTSMVEKVKQVQEQQGDLHQRFMAHQSADEMERKTREVQTTDETAEGKIRNKESREERKRGGHGESRGRLETEDDSDDEKGSDGEEGTTGSIVDIKV